MSTYICETEKIGLRLLKSQENLDESSDAYNLSIIFELDRVKRMNDMKAIEAKSGGNVNSTENKTETIKSYEEAKAELLSKGPVGVPTPPQLINDQIKEYEKFNKEFGFSKYAIIEKASNTLIGEVGFRKMDPYEKIEGENPDIPECNPLKQVNFGIIIHNEYRRNGYGIDAIIAILIWFFTNNPDKEIGFITGQYNPVTQAMISKIGMKPAGTVHLTEERYKKNPNKPIYFINKSTFETSITRAGVKPTVQSMKIHISKF